MHTRVGSKIAGYALTLLFTACHPDPPVPTASPPNVLFITIDTLRADYLGAYGGTEASTPTLDALAHNGVLFEKAVSHVPLTLPSHASIFTSLIPPSHGVRDNGTFTLEERHETLAERLRASGYRTAAFVGAFVIDAQFGLDQGFEVYDDDVAGTAENDRPADAVLDATQRWLDDVDGGTPWFAFVHLFDPHAPYEAPFPFRQRYQDAPYAGEVAYVDDSLGRFLSRLRADGMLENTLVLVTADHGEGLGEHGERTHGMFAYESTLRVPLVFHWPEGLPRGRRVPSRVRHIDIAPTVVELLGVESSASFRGRSLVGLMRGDDEADRSSYFETLTYSFNHGLAPLSGLYHDRYKFVSLPIPELYDLTDDPDERRNLARERAATVRQMASRLSRLVAAEPDSAASQPSAVDREDLDRLESLGYIASSSPVPSLGEYGPADDPKRWTHLADMMDEAVRHHRARRPAEAIELLRAIIAERGSVTIAHARLARVLHEQGRIDEAIAVLENARANGLTNAVIINALGVLLREKGDEERWSRVLRDVVESDPADAEALEALAASLLRRGLPAEAIPYLVKLVELRPDDAGAHGRLGAIYFDLDRVAESEPHLRRAVALDPEQYDTLVLIGMALADLGRSDEAREFLGRFVASAPDEVYGEDKIYVRALIDELRSASNAN